MERTVENPIKITAGAGVEEPSILVVRFSSIGDIVLTTPVLRALRKRWPAARVSFLTREKFAPLLKGNPYLDEILTLEEGAGIRELYALCAQLAGRKWSLLIDLHSSLRSRLVRRRVPADCTVRIAKQRWKRSLLIYSRLDLFGPEPLSMPQRYAAGLAPFGVRLDEKPAEIFPDESDSRKVEECLAAAGPEFLQSPLLAVAPGSAWPVKRWPAERFAAAAGELVRRNDMRVILLGASQDAAVCRTVAELLGKKLCLDLAGKLDLLASAAAVARSKLLLTNDTGLMHIATAVGTPVVAVFGPTTRQLGYFPYKANAQVVETALWCRPCTHNGRKRCPLGHFRCMRDIGVERVVQAGEGVLGKG